jgi:filamentous hemagglutinin
MALQKVTNYAYAIAGAYGIARMTLVAALPASAGETSFFAGTRYTSKVFKQMNSDMFHGFPEGVTAFEKYGIRSVIKGGDGIERQMLKIPGQYGERNGVFEFIKEADGSINHRVFIPIKDYIK